MSAPPTPAAPAPDLLLGRTSAGAPVTRQAGSVRQVVRQVLGVPGAWAGGQGATRAHLPVEHDSLPAPDLPAGAGLEPASDHRCWSPT